MTNQRVDTIDRYFKPVRTLEKASGYLFWFNLILSFGLLFVAELPTVESWLNSIFIVVTVVYSMVSLYLGLWVLPTAQNHRSTHLIADSLGVSLDKETTYKYYNNKQKPSIIRLGMNIFENSLFSWKISSRMLITERRKVVAWGFVLFLLLLYRNTPLDLISIVAQTLFATSLLSDYLRLELARYQFHKIYEDSWNLFLHGIPTNNRTNHGIILRLANRYESVKAAMTVSLNSDIFHKINDETTLVWEDIKNRLKIE